MNRFLLAATLAICGLNLFAGPTVLAADRATGVKLLPKDTLLFLSVPSIPRFKEDFHKSVMGEMFRDPELKPLLDDTWKKIEELSEMVQDEVGVSIQDLLTLLQGELTFALVERPKNKLAPVLIVDCGDSQETVQTLLKKLHESLDGELAEHSRHDVNDVTVHLYAFKNQAKDNPFKTLAYFHEDSHVVFSTEAAALKEVLNRWNGEGADSLAENEIHQYIQERCRDESGEPVVVLFASPIGLIEAGLKLGGSPRTDMVSQYLPMLGLDKLKGIGGAGYYGAGDFDVVSKLFVYADQSAGILNAFQFPAADLAPPKWVGADTNMYFAGNWNLAEAYQAIEGLVDGNFGAGYTAKQLDDAADGDLGFHIKADFLDLLDGKFHIVQRTDETDDEDQPMRMLMAFDLKDSAKMKKTLAKVAAYAEGHFETREFNGETIYDLENTSLAVVSGHLVLTTDIPALEGMLRSERQPSLVESAEYRRIARHFPAKLSLLSYSKSAIELQSLYETLKEAGGNELLGVIDIDKLPPVEVLQKYMRSSGSYGIPDKKGAMYVDFQLREGDK